MLIKYKASKAIDKFGRQGKGEIVSSRIAIYRGIVKKPNYRAARMFSNNKEEKFLNLKFNENGLLVDEKGNLIETSKVGILIDSYNNDKFCTRTEWMAYNDGELMDENGNYIKELPCEHLIIDLNDIGLMDMFLGSSYHFIKPIQRSKEESTTLIIEYDSENEKYIKKVCTIPERIKEVCNDWGVSVNVIELEKDIRASKLELDKL